MEFFNKKSNIDFMRVRIITATLSVAMFLLSFVFLFKYGLNLGLDFTGGTQMEIKFETVVNLTDVRQKLEESGLKSAEVQSYGTSKDILVSMPVYDDIEGDKLVNKVVSTLGIKEVSRVEFVGPKVGEELTTKGILAILISLIVTMIYIALRFEYKLSICSSIALIHDPVLILGVFSFFQFEFDLKILAAILAVIGYSLNDTIVVFDRVRDNFRQMRRKTVANIVNSSINQTLSRTIMTSALTLIVVLSLYIYGGETIKGFALALILGILVGTYSSIYVAGALAVSLGLRHEDFAIKNIKKEDLGP